MSKILCTCLFIIITITSQFISACNLEEYPPFDKQKIIERINQLKADPYDTIIFLPSFYDDIINNNEELLKDCDYLHSHRYNEKALLEFCKKWNIRRNEIK